MRRLAAVACIVLGIAGSSHANELRVEPRRVPADESVRITLKLTDSFAAIESVDLPVENLELSGPPSTSSEFSFVNGATSRKKTLTWWATPKGEGTGSVGPVKLVAPDGSREEIPAVKVEVTSQPAIASGDPAHAFDQLYISGRDQVLITVDAQPVDVWQGQAVSVTWSLYTAESVRNFAITSNPKLEGFWVEEIPVHDAVPEDVVVGGHSVQKVVIRRAILFPLKSGPAEIPPLEATVQVIRPFDEGGGGFPMFEGRVVDVRRKSASTTVQVRAVPDGVDAVGTFTITRGEPKTSPDGLVSLDVTVAGDGNLRSARAPRWLGAVEGDVEVEDLAIETTSKEPYGAKRSWRFVIFPKKEGTLSIPGLALETFDPASGATRQVACAAATVNVTKRPASPSGSSPAGVPADERGTRMIIAVALIAIVALSGIVIAFRLLRQKKVDPNKLDALLALVDQPRELRHELLTLAKRGGDSPAALFADPGERGEAWRAVSSLVDLMEKEPGAVPDPEAQLRARLTRLLRAL